jgi:hypothetical protein
VLLVQLVGGRDSVHLGHFDVHDHQIRAQFHGQGHGGFAIGGLAYDIKAVVT